MRKPFAWLLAVAVLLGSVRLAWHLLSSRQPRDGTSVAQATASTRGDPDSLTPDSERVRQLRQAVKGSNVLVCVLDDARADHFGCYGYSRDTTPNFDRLAKESLVFDQHFCQYTHTQSSTISLFTSQYPDTHGVLAGLGSDLSWEAAVNPDSFTLEKGLAGAGFRTMLFTSNWFASPKTGVGADFQQALRSRRLTSRRGAGSTPQKEASDRRPSASVLLEVISQQLTPQQDGCFFAYVHFLPPHMPCEAPQEIRDLFGAPANPPSPLSVSPSLYDANLRWVDQAVGALEKALRQSGLWDNTLLIVTADHGEALGEHGLKGHFGCPYDEATHIPLLVRFPGAKGPVGRITALTQTVDIAPTILDLYQVAYPKDEVQGRSLLPLIAGQATKVHDYVFTRTTGDRPWYAVRDQGFALMLCQGGQRRELYDLRADPGQTRNVIGDRPQEAERMVRAFQEFAVAQRYPPMDFVDPRFKPAKLASRPKAKVSEETKRELRSLGYLK